MTARISKPFSIQFTSVQVGRKMWCSPDVAPRLLAELLLERGEFGNCVVSLPVGQDRYTALEVVETHLGTNMLWKRADKNDDTEAFSPIELILRLLGIGVQPARAQLFEELRQTTLLHFRMAMPEHPYSSASVTLSLSDLERLVDDPNPSLIPWKEVGEEGQSAYTLLLYLLSRDAEYLLHMCPKASDFLANSKIVGAGGPPKLFFVSSEECEEQQGA